jgi:hypothetical protein
MDDDTAGIPEAIEPEESVGEERTWTDYDDDGQLIVGRSSDEEIY